MINSEPPPFNNLEEIDPVVYPKSLHFIFSSEFCDRFCFFGLASLLNQYLKSGLGLPPHVAKSQVHLFSGTGFMAPIIGATLSDSYLGKYNTILIFNSVYIVGMILLTCFSINGLLYEFGSFQLWTYIIPILLVALGSGGMRPCVASIGGDQFLPHQKRSIDRFFTIYILIAVSGKFLANIILPYTKIFVQCNRAPCYPLTFGIPSIMSFLAILLFYLGRRYYTIVPAHGEFIFYKMIKAIATALSNWRQASSLERSQRKHWIEFASEVYDNEFIFEMKRLGNVLVLILLISLVWVIEGQSLTEWQNQYELMNKNFVGIYIPTESVANISTVMVVFLTPLLGCFFTNFKYLGLSIRPSYRVILGYFSILISFLISILLEYQVQFYSENKLIENGLVISCEGCLNGIWQLPQWFFLSLGDAILISNISQLSYSQVGPMLRASGVAIGLLSVALGNYLVMILEIVFQLIPNHIHQLWCYFIISASGFIIYILTLKYWFLDINDIPSIKNKC